jgi:hypothetical protein
MNASSIPTGDLLRRTAKSVETFWDQFSGVNCVEMVDQEKVGPDGKITYRKEAKFDYLVVLQLAGNDFLVNESRSPIQEAGEGKDPPLLITNGFSMLQFIFHPFFQSGFEYSEPEKVQLDGMELFQVRFRHVTGARSPSVLKLRQREYPVPWQGTAWIDPQSAAIVRISAGLSASMEDMGLKMLNADVRYTRVEFKEDPGIHWLPSVATVEVETARQHWINVHTFTRYRYFSVDVKTGVGAAK